MAFPAITRSELLYKAPQATVSIEPIRSRTFALPRLRTPSLPEYPGSHPSVNGEGGWWRLEEYLDYKIGQAFKRRGERE